MSLTDGGRRPDFPANFPVYQFFPILVPYEQEEMCIRLLPSVLGHMYCHASTGQGPKVLPQEQHGSRGLKNKNVWFGADPLVKSVLVTQQQPRHHRAGLAASPALHGGLCASGCQSSCQTTSGRV